MNDVTQTDILQAVRSSAVLADVSISTWGGTRTDAKLLNEMKTQHGATGDVGKVMLNVLAGADDLLKKARSACAAVRLRHYELTLPWVSDPHATRQEGPRLLPNMLAERYLSEMSALKRAAMQAVEEFLAEYPNLIKSAQSNLNTMAGHIHYPSVDDLRASFRIHFDIEPLPQFNNASNGQGIPLDGSILDKLSKALHRKQERQMLDAQRHVWERAVTPIKRLIERLTDAGDKEDGKKFFKESTINAVKELVELLPGWNVTDDPNITEITDEIRDLVDGLDSKTLRSNDVVRTQTVSAAQRVADKMSRLGM